MQVKRGAFMIKLHCRACGQLFGAPVGWQGRAVKCPQCGTIHAVGAGDPSPPGVPAAPCGARSPAAEAQALAEISRAAERKPPRGKKSSLTALLVVGGGVALCAAGLVGVLIVLNGVGSSSPVLAPIADQSIAEKEMLSLAAPLENAAAWDGEVHYQLIAGPDGAAVDPATGRFTWQPTEEQGPGSHAVTIAVAPRNSIAPSDRKTFRIVVEEVNEPPQFQVAAEARAVAGRPFRLAVIAVDPDVPAATLRYVLEEPSPSGAHVDPRDGTFTWTPGEGDAGRTATFTIRAVEDVAGGMSATLELQIAVTAPDRPIDRIVARLREAGLKASAVQEVPAEPFSGSALAVQVTGGRLRSFEYPSAEAAEGEAAQIAADATTLFGRPQSWLGPVHLYKHDRWLACYEGNDAEVLSHVAAALGPPIAAGGLTEAATVAASILPPTPVPTEAAPPAPAADEEALLQLYRDKKLLSPKEYPAVRRIFAERFEREHARQIEAAYSPDAAAMNDWLAAHVDLKEEFYTAIDPQHDDVGAALALFKEIKNRFPDKIVPYGSLAIAASVVWDKPRGGVYEYGHHAARTKSTVPEGTLDALANFQYLVETEPLMQGRVQYVPWEFLVHVVNHRTPLVERQWAMQNYLPRRVMFGRCYSDVPYDDEMLRTGGQVCRLAGKPYDLANIRLFGGVCAMQADFASRVGKSMGVPSAYVRGESNSNELHAWVMWVELQAANANQIAFTLQSHGRYRGDKYYVGTLSDPHTGRQITDRQLELRLHTVGMNAVAKRQTALAMRAFPTIREKESLDVAGQMAFLGQVISACPGNEGAWIALAELSRDGRIDKTQHKQMMTTLDLLFRTFAAFPDFTWTVFDDLAAFQSEPKAKIALYERLTVLYEQAGRPDLACEARLKLTDYLVEQKQFTGAVEGLALSIKKFADEGRYVPRMLDRLEAICGNTPEAKPLLLRFYAEFLPLIPKKRGSDPNKHCIAMYERGISRFKEAGETAAAFALESALEAIKKGQAG
jgi:hypothetical protein